MSRVVCQVDVNTGLVLSATISNAFLGTRAVCSVPSGVTTTAWDVPVPANQGIRSIAIAREVGGGGEGGRGGGGEEGGSRGGVGGEGRQKREG